MYDETNNKNLWLEIVVYGTAQTDYHSNPQILFYGVNPNEELYRILISHPLVDKPGVSPGQERFYELDILPIIKGLSWTGHDYDWDKIHLADAYIGSEIWSDAKSSFTVSEFDVLYENIQTTPTPTPTFTPTPTPSPCSLLGPAIVNLNQSFNVSWQNEPNVTSIFSSGWSGPISPKPGPGYLPACPPENPSVCQWQGLKLISPGIASVTLTTTDNQEQTGTCTYSVTNTSIPGDTDGDGDVDIFDYNTLVSNFGTTDCGNEADFDNDCDVDIFDYNTLVTNFGQ